MPSRRRCKSRAEVRGVGWGIQTWESKAIVGSRNSGVYFIIITTRAIVSGVTYSETELC